MESLTIVEMGAALVHIELEPTRQKAGVG